MDKEAKPKKNFEEIKNSFGIHIKGWLSYFVWKFSDSYHLKKAKEKCSTIDLLKQLDAKTSQNISEKSKCSNILIPDKYRIKDFLSSLVSCAGKEH